MLTVPELRLPLPLPLPPAEEVAEPVVLKERSFHRKVALELERLLRESQLDYEKIRNVMCRAGTLDPNYTDKVTKMATIHHCAFDGQADVLRWCLEAGADVDVQTAIGRSPLHYACNGNRVSCIRVLLENRADPNLRSLSNQTPLHICCMYNCYEATLELLNGASGLIDIEAEDTRRRIPEALAKDKQILRAIRKYRATLDERRQADMIEQALQRLFHLLSFRPTSAAFVDSLASGGFVLREDLAACLRVLERHLPGCNSAPVAQALQLAAAKEGRISFDGFRSAQMAVMQEQPEELKDLLVRLNDLEVSIFKETVRSEGPEDGVSEVIGITPRAKEVAVRRASRPLLTGARAIMGIGAAPGLGTPKLGAAASGGAAAVSTAGRLAIPSSLKAEEGRPGSQSGRRPGSGGAGLAGGA